MLDKSGGSASFVRSVVFWGDGSMTARYGYKQAVQRLFEYEISGVAPDAATGRSGNPWERYTARAPNGDIFARRGWECVLGRLNNYEQSRLTPEQWEKRFGVNLAETNKKCFIGK